MVVETDATVHSVEVAIKEVAQNIAGKNRRIKELEAGVTRLQTELSWIYSHCELRDGDNTQCVLSPMDSDDVQSAIAVEAIQKLEEGKYLRRVSICGGLSEAYRGHPQR